MFLRSFFVIIKNLNLKTTLFLLNIFVYNSVDKWTLLLQCVILASKASTKWLCVFFVYFLKKQKVPEVMRS